AVVALPLALAFGVASGAGPLPGLYGSIFIGFFAALFGGTPSQISGPTGPMTVVLAGVISKFPGQPDLVFAAVALAGVFQMVMGALDIGQYIRLVSLSVTSGFMSGIGCIILCTQSLAILGSAPAPNCLAAFKALPQALQAINSQALAVGLLALACCYLTPKKISRIVPGSLLGLITGTLTAVYARLDVPRLGAIPSGLPQFRLPAVPQSMYPQVIQAALMLAALGAIDSLLTSLVADQLTQDYHDSDKELVGQGLGNAISGLFGGVAGAGATMRTVVNIRAGGRSPISGAVHSIVLLAVVVGLGRFAGAIPLAVLAGVLLKSGWDIIDWKYIRRARALSKSSVLIMATVLLCTMFGDLIAAVALGTVMNSLIYTKKMAAVQVESCTIVCSEEDAADGSCNLQLSETKLLRQAAGRVSLFNMQTVFTFNAANGILRKLLPAMSYYESNILDLSNVELLDDTAALAVDDLIDHSNSLSKTLYVCGANKQGADMLHRLGVAAKLPAAMADPTVHRRVCLQYAVQQLGSPEILSTSNPDSQSNPLLGQPEPALP
ncbi:hypothetical protein WJX84_001428, partial [Apatococcus fuscideae]